MLLRPKTEGRYEWVDGEVRLRDKHTDNYTVDDWMYIFNQGFDAEAYNLHNPYDPMLETSKWQEREIEKQEAKDAYAGDYELYQGSMEVKEGADREAAYLKSLEELAALEARRKQLEALNKAGIKAGKYGSSSGRGGAGGIGSAATTMLQEIDTSKGDLLK